MSVTSGVSRLVEEVSLGFEITLDAALFVDVNHLARANSLAVWRTGNRFRQKPCSCHVGRFEAGRGSGRKAAWSLGRSAAWGRGMATSRLEGCLLWIRRSLSEPRGTPRLTS